MSTFRGTVKKNDIEGGIWELHAEDGTRYQIRGGNQSLLKTGQRVEITGRINQEAFGIGMTGPYLDVSAWKAI